MKRSLLYLLQNTACLMGGLTQLFYRYKGWHRYKKQDAKGLSKTSDEVAQSLYKNGYAVIEDYLSDDECKVWRDEIDQQIEVNKNRLWQDEQESDTRFYGIERFTKQFDTLKDDAYLKKLAKEYMAGQELGHAFTLAGRLRAVPGSLGSGGGWHRDAFGRQFKTILYLSDVNKTNGPFQLIEQSHELKNIVKDMKCLKAGFNQVRYSNESMDRLISGASARLKTCVAKAGTLIIVNTALIHRGAPITEGMRYAITNYFFPTHELENKLKSFSKVLNAK